jgi:3-dehydro-L-gulonate 2-dehydrogenase
MITVTAAAMQSQFKSVLLKYGFEKDKAVQCATIFTENSIDGIYTHAVNRFPRFVQNVKDGFIKANAVPSLKHKFNGIEQWDGNLGPGPLNALAATQTAIDLSKQYGIGCVTLSNTNHWMRGGAYGWQAAKEGVVCIAWTNTIANMPAWNAADGRLGNNPLVIALPYKDEAIVLDMAMSQFSFGAMEMAVLKNEKLSVAGGYDLNGNLTNDPAAIIQSRKPLPVGYWKGAGLSLLLDILAAVLSGGLSTHEISKRRAESAVSQVFVCIDLAKLDNHSSIATIISNIIEDYKLSVPLNDTKKISYPGERVLATREKNLKDGIPVLKSVWENILSL